MQFLNPWLLFGLVAVAIPIIVHLFNFRRYRKLYFSNVEFLKELKQQTRKQSTLLHRLILMCRILAVAFIALAFAQPFFAESKVVPSQKQKVVSVFVDNSYSMETEGTRGTLFDEAKAKALEVIAAYAPDDQFQLLTNDFEGKHQRLVSKDEFSTMLKDITLSPSVRSLSEITARQKDVLGNDKGAAFVHYISDFQQSTIFGALPDTGIAQGFLIPLVPASRNNLFVDTCWFENPVLQLNEQATLHVRITNVSDVKLEKIPVKLMIDDSQRAVASVDVFEGGSEELSFTFRINSPGSHSGFIEINDFPVTYDDIYYFAFTISPQIKVLSINDDKPNQFINAVFSVDSVIRLTNTTVRQVDFSSFNSYSLIILNEIKAPSTGLVQELSKFAENGGSVMFIPSMDAPAEQQNLLLAGLGLDAFGGIDNSPLKLSSVNTTHPLYKEVFEQGLPATENIDFPLISSHFSTISSSASRGETLLEMANGRPLLSTVSTGTGTVYQFTAPMSDKAGNFVRHALFVPTMLNIAFQSEKVGGLMYFTDYAYPIRIKGNPGGKDNVVKVSEIGGDIEFIPEMRQMNGQNYILLNGQATKAGLYRVMAENEEIDLLAFNFNRKESHLRPASAEEIDNLVEITGYEVIEHSPKPLNQVLTEEANGKNIWKWLVIAAIAAVVAEVLLLLYARRKVKALV